MNSLKFSLAFLAGWCLCLLPMQVNAFQEAPPASSQLQQEEQEEADKAKDADEKSEKSDAEQEEAEEKQEESSPRDGDNRRRNNNTRRRRQSTRGQNSRASTGLLKTFAPVIKEAAEATVKIKKGDETVALGAIVSSDGFVLTKQSELVAPFYCELQDGTKLSASVYGVHDATDLALLKVDSEDKLPVISWDENQPATIGNWLATVRDDDRALKVGVVGVNARLIRPQSGFMGVNLQQAENGVRITNVTQDSPAEKGGLKVDDIVTRVNMESLTDVNKLTTKVKSFPPGEEIRVTVVRNSREVVLTIVLGEERALNPNLQRSNAQNTMGGSLSQRRQNFPMAVQHDTFLSPEDCGGPVVNLDGQVVGINIARSGRVSSLMLPASVVLPVIEELKTGQLAPAIVHSQKIQNINRRLQDLTTQLSLAENAESLKDDVKKFTREEKKLREELEAKIRDRIRAELELELATQNKEVASSEIEVLEAERKRLVTGSK